ncbi:MAG: mycothione reductase [Rothia sp. (in: high G+C Gram-positive bacteria)]|uniref:mycothione reductase n=1 Tax=Rothia sp. (in: high G+C Gram-positive bacteria) TaxID=1885016 RepID=UPI0026E0DB11|nr:mycothione reductase [Rothia sp. (in: high G+C Gram-positive bacteria)]MDO5751049.1 mycothione reductase [Rothia sp. (in: high G+C Gram-positive bacteria)]
MSIENLAEENGVKLYDLVIIGSGSGNTIIGPEWDDKHVALIDGGIFGGTCLNVGCIPTKMFVYPATIAAKTREVAALGVQASVQSVDWVGMRERIFGQRIDRISAGGRDWRAGLPNVDFYPEYARFTGTHELVTSSGVRVRGRQVVVAAGSRAVLPEVPGIDLPQVHTNDTMMRLENLPARTVVLGGGVIAAEFAHVFSALGSQVTQVHRSSTLLRGVDEEIVQRFESSAREQWTIATNHALREIRPASDGAGTGAVTVVCEHEGRAVEFEADAVLVATGRTPNTDRLDAAQFFDVAECGSLRVDRYQRVLSDGEPVEGVYALGDVSSDHLLKHVANHQARLVQHNLSHPHDLRADDNRPVPAAVFSHPQIAYAGLTESEARELAVSEGFEVRVKTQNYGDTAYGWAMEDSVGALKLIARADTGQLLGAFAVGEEAATLIQPLVQAMTFDLDVHSMARGQYWIHPALTEVVENALLGLEIGPQPAL